MVLVQPEWMASRRGPQALVPAVLLSLVAHAALLFVTFEHQAGTRRTAPDDLTLEVALNRPGRAPRSEPRIDPEPQRDPFPAPREVRPRSDSSSVVTSSSPRARSAAPVSATPPRRSASSDRPMPLAPEPPEFGDSEADDSWREIADFGTVPLPVFPPPIISWGEAVVLVMRLHVRPDGSVERVDIVRSSGFPSLDDAAIQAALARRFDAADQRALERRVVFYEGEDT